jgi:diacylglycerol kinase family enzyme
LSAPIRIGPAGEKLAVMVNANAKRGGRRVAVQIARALPGATVKLTRTQAEMDAWLRAQLDLPRPPACFLAAGGDGTVVALVNALARVVEGKLPPFGILPLGTGNAWANSTGAPKLGTALALLDEAGSMGRAMPVRRFGIAVATPEGGASVLTHMAGSGWDAQILNDYKVQLAATKSARAAKSVYGYLGAVLFRTTPKLILRGRPNVVVEALGDEVFVFDPGGHLVRSDARRGSILYDGPVSVAGVATCPEFGYRFKAYPHAERFLGKLSVRVYDRTPLGGIRDIPKLWVGAPLAGMHDWFTCAVRMTFDRPTPMQIGGDAVGVHRVVEYRISDREAHVLDWRLLR